MWYTAYIVPGLAILVLWIEQKLVFFSFKKLYLNTFLICGLFQSEKLLRFIMKHCYTCKEAHGAGYMVCKYRM